MSNNKPFLKSIHYFRAFAIINIVIIHIWHIPSNNISMQNLELIDLVRLVLFHDATIYFLLISGFLFHYLSGNPGFSIKKYYLSKIKYILFPYTIISLFLYLIKNNSLLTADLFSFFKGYIDTLVYGKAAYPLWYIPFICGIYLISPLLLKIPTGKFKYFTVFSSLIPLFIGRTGVHITISQYAYYLPSYVIGMYMSINYKNILEYIKTHFYKLILISTITTICLFFVSVYNINVDHFNISESLYYIQKLNISFILFLLFSKIENWKNKIVYDFATYSFGIYFLHTFFGNESFRNIYYSTIYSLNPSLVIPSSILFVIIVAFTNLYTLKVFKKITGKKARYIVGV